MRRIIPIFSLLLLVVLFGCTQGGIPSACSGMPAGELANCVYVSAVLEQNPYNCYSLANISQREKCLRDSSDPAAVKLLQRMSPEERARIFAAEPGAVTPPAETTIPTDTGTPPSGAAPGQVDSAAQADTLLYEQATNGNDMAQCAAIANSSVRASCITQVALRVKNPEVCALLTEAGDVDLCNLYAKAGEQAK